MFVAGSLQAIRHEIHSGTPATVIDEILHSRLFDRLVGHCEWRLRFCQWAHRNDEERVNLLPDGAARPILIACACCGRGWPATQMRDGRCPECAPSSADSVAILALSRARYIGSAVGGARSRARGNGDNGGHGEVADD